MEIVEEQLTPVQQELMDELKKEAEQNPTPPGMIAIHALGKGGGSWAPYIDPAVDYSQWGQWEAWQFLAFGPLPDGTVGAYPTGDWIAWDRVSGQQIGFNDKAHATARQQAIILCNLRNGMYEVSDEELAAGLPFDKWKVNPLAKPCREVVSMPLPSG